MPWRRASVGIALLLAACSTQLERGLTPAQADEIVLALGEHGIGASRETTSDGTTVTVLASDVASALAVMRDEGLPRIDAPGVAETFAEPSLVPTAGEERARAGAALAADLARTIEALDGVHDARVHVGLPDPTVIPMDDAPAQVAASVLVRTTGTVDEAAIRALVSGAVPGLSSERVTVVATPFHARAPSAPPLVTVGPIHVTAGSALALRVALATMLGVNVLLAVLLGVVVRRRR